jgi:uncharacterized protein
MDEDLPGDIRLWGMACHLAAFSWLPMSALAWSPGKLFLPVPFINVIVTFCLWRWRRNWHDFIDDQGRESLNFQLSQLVYALMTLVLILFILVASFVIRFSSLGSNLAANFWSIGLIISGFIMLTLVLLQITLTIFASVKAMQGQSYRYPFTLRFFN